jgi:hypothetical protein
MRICQSHTAPVTMCENEAKYCLFADFIDRDQSEPKPDVCEEHLKDKIVSLLDRYDVVEVLKILGGVNDNSR